MGPHFTTTARRTAAAGDSAIAGDRVRQRAEALLPGRGVPGRGDGGAATGAGGGAWTGAVPPPGRDARAGTGARFPAPVAPQDPPAARSSTAGRIAEARSSGPDDRDHPPPAGTGAGPGERLRRVREAVCERLPVWVRLRCGLEARTVLALAAVLVFAVALAVHHFWSARPHTVTVPPLAGPASLATAAHTRPGPADPAGGYADTGADPPEPGAGPLADPPPPVPAGQGGGGGPAAAGGTVVDVAGKVRSPGVLRLPAGSRVTDALKAAGGPLPGTDTSSLNLARLLVDGEQLLVGRPPQAPAAPPGAPGAAPAGPVSLNGATPDQLDTLPGVGPVLARHIVEYRQRHGGFTSVSQLRQVTGVGDRRYDELRALVRP